MTRLKSADVEHLGGELGGYHKRLKKSLGITLGELGCLAAGVDPELIEQTAANFRVAAVPITSGEGVITHFCESLVDISRSLGFEAEVTSHTDIAGMAEAYQGGYDIVLSSDDDLFCAINLKTGRVIDNSIATARGFVYGLDALAGGLVGKPVLVLGCGPVGLAGIETIHQLGGKITVFDPQPDRCQEAVNRFPDANIQVAANLEEGLAAHTLIFEATPVANTVDAAFISSESCMAAPGVPCGATEAAAELLGSRLLWDPLQIGVATMLMAAAFASKSEHCALN